MKNKIITKSIKSILCVALFGAMFTGCEKDFLNVQPTDRVSNASILNDQTLFEAYVINRYLGVKLTNKEGDSNQPGFGRTFEWAMWSSLTDESIYNNDDNTWLIQQGQLSPENLGIAGTLWGRSYRGIREVNYALNNIGKVPMSDSRKSLLTAELKFIRAFRYQDLIRNYGKVVLLGDKVSELGNDFSDPSLFDRRPIDECMTYVVNQLDEAATGLPTANSSDYGEGRATKGAALALKSRLLLYAASPLYNNDVSDTQKWAKAAAAAKAVMDLGIYSLYTGGYANLFTTAGSNSEYIFARFYNVSARHLPLEIANGPNGYSAWGGNLPLQNLVDDYEMADGTPFSWSNPTEASAPYDNRDPRFAATVIYNGLLYRGRNAEYFLPGGKDSSDGKDNWNTSKTGYNLRKFMRDDLPIDNPWDVGGQQNWIHFRYGEILLNYAEAQNEAVGPDASVYSAIHLIRARAGMPDFPAGLTKEQMRDRVRHERRIELAFEEHRFYDVRRWKIASVTENKPAQGIIVRKQTGGSFTYELKNAIPGRSFQNQHYWLPIPRSEIQASNNKLEQNPGY